MVALAMALGAAACGAADDGPATESAVASTEGDTSTSSDQAEDPTPTTDDAPATTSSTTPSTTVASSGSSTSSSRPTAESGAAELLAWLGAERLVARQADGTVVARTGQGDLGLATDYPVVRGPYLFDDGILIDFDGQPACRGFELLGDYHVIDDVEPGDAGQPAVIVEDRRALAANLAKGTAPVPRWRYDCDTGTTTDLDPASTVTYQPDAIEVTTTEPSGLTLVSTWGLGDSPLVLATGSGTSLLDGDDLAYDHVLSQDEATIYATAYADTGAASPPVAVLAIEVATGEERWRRDLPGFVWTLGDRVLIEVVDWDPERPGRSPAREILFVDPATGADLDRMAFSDRLVALS